MPLQNFASLKLLLSRYNQHHTKEVWPDVHVYGSPVTSQSHLPKPASHSNSLLAHLRNSPEILPHCDQLQWNHFIQCDSLGGEQVSEQDPLPPLSLHRKEDLLSLTSHLDGYLHRLLVRIMTQLAPDLLPHLLLHG